MVPFDEERYLHDLLRPAREGRIQLKDPYVRYGFADDLSGDDEFNSQVTQVRRCWERLKEETEWRDLVGPLRADHDHWTEEGRLDKHRFSELRKEAESKALRWLESRIQEENTTHCTADFVAMLVRQNGLAETQRVIKALDDAGITLVDQLADLPVGPPPEYRDLRNAAQALRLGLSAELILESDPAWQCGFLVLEGFRLKAKDARLTAENLRLARDVSHERDRDHARTEYRQTLVSALEVALAAGELDELLLWEVVQPLRELARDLGKTGALHQRALAASACERGLDPDEAGRLALAVIIEYQARAKPVAPPAPPASVRAAAGPDGVWLSWPPSTDVTVPVVYRVVLSLGDWSGHPVDGEVVVEETRGISAEDRHPPAGEELRYTVFAGGEVRAGAGPGGLSWSGPAIAPAVYYTPEVTSLCLKATGPRTVAGAWTMPAQAGRSRVTRVANDGEIAVRSDRDAFVDTGLTPGAQYRYLVRACYQVRDGTWRESSAIVGTIQLAPEPVESLSLTQAPGLTRVTCAPPSAGQVSWFLSDVPLRWPLGCEIDLDGLSALGEPLAVSYRLGNGELAAEFAPPPGRHFLFAVTTAGQRSVMGATSKLGQVEPVSELVARRLSGRPGELDQALLGWAWPDGASSSIVTWRGDARTFTRHGYHADGGAAIPIGLDNVTIEVAALHLDTDGDWLAEAARVTLPARLADSHLTPAVHDSSPSVGRRRGPGPAELLFRRRSDYRIVITGGPGTGKTVLVTVLGHELMNRLGTRFGLAVEAADDFTQQRYSDGYEYPLYQEFRLPAATPTFGAADSRPLPFTITTAAPQLAGLWRARRVGLTVADIAGADSATDASFTEATRELGAVHGVVLVTDLSSPSAGPDLVSQLDRVTRVFGRRAALRPLLAIVLTKIDLLGDELPQTSPLRGLPYSDESDAREVHAEVARLLAGRGAAGLDEFTDSGFRRFRYFGVSALGETPRPDGRVSPRGIRPYRVNEPLLWLLAGFGIIPAQRSSQWRSGSFTTPPAGTACSASQASSLPP